MWEELRRELGEVLAGSDGASLIAELVFDQTAATANLIRCLRLGLLAGEDPHVADVKRAVREYQLERVRLDSLFMLDFSHMRTPKHPCTDDAQLDALFNDLYKAAERDLQRGFDEIALRRSRELQRDSDQSEARRSILHVIQTEKPKRTRKSGRGTPR